MAGQHHKHIVCLMVAVAAMTACGSSEETTPSTQARGSSQTTITAIETPETDGGHDRAVHDAVIRGLQHGLGSGRDRPLARRRRGGMR